MWEGRWGRAPPPKSLKNTATMWSAHALIIHMLWHSSGTFQRTAAGKLCLHSHCTSLILEVHSCSRLLCCCLTSRPLLYVELPLKAIIVLWWYRCDIPTLWISWVLDTNTKLFLDNFGFWTIFDSKANFGSVFQMEVLWWVQTLCNCGFLYWSDISLIWMKSLLWMVAI